jgi:predicted PurR-regulated permease PerM
MQSVLIPFVLGGLLFYALDPAVDRLQKLRVPRALGAAAMLLIVVTGCGALAYLLQGQAGDHAPEDAWCDPRRARESAARRRRPASR